MTTLPVSVLLGFTANILSNIAFLPQIIKSFRRKKVDDLSIGMFLLLFITQLCWMGYAIPIHAQQLWTSSLTEILLLVPIFVLWLRYRTKKNSKNCLAADCTEIE